MRAQIKRYLQLLVLFLAFFSTKANAQETQIWPTKSNSVSAYATFGLGAHMNLSYNYLKYTGGAFFHGFTMGASLIYLEGFTYGPHAAYSMMIGKKDHHLDIRMGIVYPLDDDVTFISFVPLLSLAYRFQKPDGKGYFRAGLSSGGIGIGVGRVLK